ncbi:hypothetical protein RXV86_19910 [Alisedimentitalea sp. MJ-SS2]|uniref:hypothetical protein n=1 Tax=Aliisedimentitalea sp. MJ-SS2 TaxID=3049795 RepID=UPI00290C9895|nr:hypothetical protein [Alisedimentitalea sp. MJ-SS2]MDU8929658.1 hypothetical protein [Alisedimentitalea sp. MJ-SS2]
MLAYLILGLTVGMAHALEADHLAAVGALAARKTSSRRRMAWLGASWGLGHTTTLLLMSMPVVLLGLVLSARVASGLEFAVGVMLVTMGVGVLLKLYRTQVHIHVHDHANGSRHFHAHSHHDADQPHTNDAHDHDHASPFSRRSYLVGMIHGLAGSAALVAMAAATQSIVATLGYVVAFGFGSTLGMAALTLAMSWPLQQAERAAGRIFRGVQYTLAGAAMVVGASVMAASGPAVWGGY